MADSASSETVNDSLNKEGRAEAPDCADGLASSKFADSEGKFDKRGRRRGRGTPQDISESKAPEKPLNKQQIWNILFQLHNDPDPLASYRFPATLKNDDRRYIHTACQKLHLKSKSRGSGIHRCLTVWKSDKSVDERLTPLEIHEDILTMFRNHSTSSKHSIKNCKEFMMKVAGMQNKQAFPRSSSANRGNSGHDSKKALGLLQRHLVDRKMDDKFAKLLAFRKNLPAFKMKQQILKLVRDSQVCLISGSTGCGKSTQVPQLILEAEVNKYVCAESKRDVQGEKVDSRAPLRIICTQPRRLSAIALCSRVAEEFGGKVGEYIGYQVRLDSKIGPHTAITFCTVGILLRILQSDPNADRFTHIIVDEVHERDRLTDFLLIILKQIMKRNKHLKIIMMSATLNADKFSKYFATESIQCPEIKIPGMSFPVRVHQLEDVLTLTKYRPRPDQLRVKDAHYLKLWTDYYQKRIPMKTIIEIANLDGASVTEELKPDYELIKSLFTSIVKNMECGAILIFLPGWNEIIKTVDTLALSEIVSRNPKKFKILPLHSSVAPHQQKQIFVRPPKGTWKIIVSTNIAETSLTIDDVLYVIDSGLSKQKSFDAHTGMSSLVSNWTSQASARQRQGRAGRVRAGTCFRLYSGARYHNMEPFETPEMLRTPLEEICLQIKLLRLDDNLFANHKGKIFDFLSLAIEPPTSTMVNKAIELLGSIGAMQKEERLTPLGIVLASMPCDPRLSKMLIFAVALKCLGPILTVGACISYRTPFVMALPFERDRARKKKQHFARGCLSDGIAMYSAYTDWIKAEKEGRGFSFCKQNFLSAPSLRMIRSIRGQLFRLLQNARVIPRECTFPEHNQLNRFSKDFNIVRSVIAVGAYPNVAVGVKQKKRKPYDFMTRDNMKNLKIHPSSVNRFTMKNSKAAESKSSVLPFFPYLAFFEVMRSTDVFLHTTSVRSVKILHAFASLRTISRLLRPCPSCSSTATLKRVKRKQLALCRWIRSSDGVAQKKQFNA